MLTFNYDTVVESALEQASGVGAKRNPSPTGWLNPEDTLSDEDLDASRFAWNRALALGFEFDELAMPVVGDQHYVGSRRYYSHPNNKLLRSTRVLKLHGSIDWLRYTDQRTHVALQPRVVFPPHVDVPSSAPPSGIVLEPRPRYSYEELPSRDGWLMEPIVIPPLLYKEFAQEPIRTVWSEALLTLRECETLIVIGYSFPPTDFRTRRLFLEAFSEPHLEKLIVISPDPAVAGIVRHLTHFTGAITICDDLRALYGLPTSWHEYEGPLPPGMVVWPRRTGTEQPSATSPEDSG